LDVVFQFGREVKHLGLKREFNLERTTPISTSQFQPWDSPFRLHSLSEYYTVSEADGLFPELEFEPEEILCMECAELSLLTIPPVHYLTDPLQNTFTSYLVDNLFAFKSIYPDEYIPY